MTTSSSFPVTLKPETIDGSLAAIDRQPILPGGRWHRAETEMDGFTCTFEPGTLSGATHLCCDMLLDGNEAVTMGMFLQEGPDGPKFFCHFALLNQCQARMRLPLEALNQNRWLFDREGAWMKVICSGDRLDPARIDRLQFFCYRKGPKPVQWCMTDLKAVDIEPSELTDPLLPAGPLLDEFGQSTLRNWAGKTRDETDLIERLQGQLAEAEAWTWPENFSRYGGSRETRFEATGYFRTHHDGRRWWLVDPEGFAFWSAGLDCVRDSITANVTHLEKALTWSPESDAAFADAHGTTQNARINDFFRANLIRAFGADQWRDRWETLAVGMLRRFGFNTMANWSDWEIAARAGMPYVRQMTWPAAEGPKVERIFRDLPDVFDPAFEQEAAAYAAQLADTAEDPAFIGYFLMNEPKWGFASITPAEGILSNTDTCHSRRAMAGFLRDKYGDETALAAAWGEPVDFAEIERGRWTRRMPPGAGDDLETFSMKLAEGLFSTLSRACKAVDPNHLNLGARYASSPPLWARRAMACFDVFSINCYRERVDRRVAEACEAMNLPAMIGEWHFGALDVGLPATGIGHVPNQADRGRAYRVYVEDAATQPWCVGVHYFTLYDQSALGRPDGENYNIGFVDICHRPYRELAEAARAAHEKLYDVATGKAQPYDDAPQHLPRLFY